MDFISEHTYLTHTQFKMEVSHSHSTINPSIISIINYSFFSSNFKAFFKISRTPLHPNTVTQVKLTDQAYLSGIMILNGIHFYTVL